MAQARLNIIEPNGVRRSMPLTLQGVVVGRDPTCEVPLVYERISRQHVQIAFDGQRCYVVDLESKNGTYLGKTRLEPNIPTLWSPDQALRVGDIYFNLEIPNYQETRREAAEQMETMVGHVPVHIQQKDNRKTLWWVLGGIGLLCACTGLAGLAFFFLGV